MALIVSRWRASVRVDGPFCTSPNGSRTSWIRFESSSSDAEPTTLVALDSVYHALRSSPRDSRRCSARISAS
jgi:hypothetical protein